MENNKLVTFETESDFRINSYEFLNNIINPTRIDSGNNKIRHNDFINKINDELDDEELVYEKTVDLQNKSINVAILNYDQAILVGMRESKAIRKTVLLTLKKLIVGSSEQSEPLTRLEIAKQLVEAEERTLELENKNKDLALHLVSGMTPTEFCKSLHGVNVMDVMRILCDKGHVKKRRDGRGYVTRCTARDKYFIDARTCINGHNTSYQVEITKRGANYLFEQYKKGELTMKNGYTGAHRRFAKFTLEEYLNHDFKHRDLNNIKNKKDVLSDESMDNLTKFFPK